MKNLRTTLLLAALAVTTGSTFSGCYTRVATYDENGTTYWDRDQDTTSQSQSYGDNGYDQFGDHRYLGFEY